MNLLSGCKVTAKRRHFKIKSTFFCIFSHFLSGLEDFFCTFAPTITESKEEI